MSGSLAIVNPAINRGFKGVWIPKEIWLSTTLTLQEKVFLVEINSLDQGDLGCYAGNKHFAGFFGLSEDRCSEIISSLVKKNMVTVSVKRDSGKSVRTITLTTRRKHRVGGGGPLGGNTECPLGGNTEYSNTVLSNTEERENPIIPFEEVLPEDSSTHPYTEPPEESLTISVDNNTGLVDTVLAAMGKRSSDAYGKDRAALLALVEEQGKESVVAAFFKSGCKTVKEFLKQGKPRFQSRNQAEPGHQSFNRRLQVVRSTPPYPQGPQRSSNRRKPIAPLEATLWNERIPSRPWRIWDEGLHAAMQVKLADADFCRHYEEILEKVSAIVAANHERAVHVQLSWVLKDEHWSELLNGSYDWALTKVASHKPQIDTSMDSALAKVRAGKI